MAAWRHWAFWDGSAYQGYRKYVSQRAPAFRGRDDLDCADISIYLLIDYAAQAGLPVTFWDNNQASSLPA